MIICYTFLYNHFIIPGEKEVSGHRRAAELEQPGEVQDGEQAEERHPGLGDYHHINQ